MAPGARCARIPQLPQPCRFGPSGARLIALKSGHVLPLLVSGLKVKS